MKQMYYILILGCWPFLLFAQNREISGVVLSEADRETLVGVTVQEKGSDNAVVTDADGRFTIRLKGENAVLIFRFVGCVTQELPARSSMKVLMKEDLLQLEEVMVTAYGTSKKASFTGSAAVIDNKKIEKLQVSSVSQLLQGGSSGVQVVSSDGQPGSDATIRIRGISSINGVSSPLYVVDGTPYGGYINAINPADIESITVLKDASATALYGSRAAAGVVMITTKKGKSEVPQFNFRANWGFSQLAVGLHETLSPARYHEMGWEAIRNGYLDNGMGISDYAAAVYASDNLLSYLKVNLYGEERPVGTDGHLSPGLKGLWRGNSWENALFKKRLRQEYNVDVNGASERVNYFISLGYLDDKATLTVSEFERYSGRINVNSNVTDWFEMGLNASFAHSVNHSPDQSRVIRFVREVPDIYPVYEWDYHTGAYKRDEDNCLIPDFGAYRPTNAWPNANPLAEARYDQRYSEQENITVRLNAALHLPYHLKLKVTGGVDYSIASGYYYYNNQYGWAASVGGQSSRDRNRFFVYTFNTILSWDKVWKEHHLNVMGGHEIYSSKSNFLSAMKENFPMGGMTELGGAATLKEGTSSEDNLRLEGYLFKLDYDYRDRYYVSGSYRRDGSSRFASAKRWGDFWSVGASWRISNEEFMRGLEWVDNLKLKISYGAQGNDNIGSLYGYQGSYVSGWNDLTHPGYLVGALPTPHLEWETNRQLNVGIEARIFNRIEFSFEWYDRKTENLLFWRDLPPSSGIKSVKDNIGDLRNRGIEVQINTVNIVNDRFRWETDLNVSHYRNEILKLPVKEKINGLHKWEVGKSVYEFYMPEWAGVDPATGDGNFWLDVYDRDEQGQLLTDAKGEYVPVGKMKVQNYGSSSRYFQGSALPKVFGGFTNNFFYRNFDLSVFLYYSIGGLAYDSDYAQLMHSGNLGINWSKDIRKRWTPSNRYTSVPRVTTASNEWNSVSSRFLYDASYVRVKNITFGYTLPEALTKRCRIDKLRLFVRGDNLFTWTKHKGMDPEMSIDGVSANRLTSMKTFSAGLDLTF